MHSEASPISPLVFKENDTTPDDSLCVTEILCSNGDLRTAYSWFFHTVRYIGLSAVMWSAYTSLPSSCRR